MVTINGSIEIVRGNESTGITGTEWIPDEVPIVLRNLHGIRDMGVVDPVARPTGRTPEYQWDGKDANNQDVAILLWADVPFRETYAAQIGPGLAEPKEG